MAHNTNGGLGLLVIRSVYDFDGVDLVAAETANAVPNIAALADPKATTADQRPARFVRIEKAVEIPDKTVRKINASAFGPAGMGMREILAYAPVEPDGSVTIQLPANVPFTIDILDKNARRIGAVALQLDAADCPAKRRPATAVTSSAARPRRRTAVPDSPHRSMPARRRRMHHSRIPSRPRRRPTPATPWRKPGGEHLRR